MTTFPRFKKLEIEDQLWLEKYVRKYPPYSDFNFVSLWSYDTQATVETSFLHNNLVVRFLDYMTNELFYSFLGRNNVEITIETLLDHSRRNNMKEELGMVPGDSLLTYKQDKKFLIKEDVDNFDYILDVGKISTLAGNKLRGKRNFSLRFQKLYSSHEVRILDVSNLLTQQEILDLFYLWERQKGKERKDTENELIAIQRLMTNAKKFNLLNLGIYFGGKLIAFSINELIHDDYTVIDFEKADTTYIGIYQYLKQQSAKHFLELGYRCINYEQDLGIEGLRKAKLSWSPSAYLKKYKISRR